MRRLADTLVEAVPDSHQVEGFGPVTVDLPADRWIEALTITRDAGAVFFDFLTCYETAAAEVAVVAHVARDDASDRVLLRTTVVGEAPEIESATSVYPGAAWHEREAHEMFGVVFIGHPGLEPLLLGPGAPRTPLRKQVLLPERLARPWPGDADPADSTGRPRRRTPPPGVPADHVVVPAAPATLVPEAGVADRPVTP